VDDNSMLITANNLNDLPTKLISTLNSMSAQFSVNSFSLHMKKINTVKFS